MGRKGFGVIHLDDQGERTFLGEGNHLGENLAPLPPKDIVFPSWPVRAPSANIAVADLMWYSVPQWLN